MSTVKLSFSVEGETSAIAKGTAEVFCTIASMLSEASGGDKIQDAAKIMEGNMQGLEAFAKIQVLAPEIRVALKECKQNYKPFTPELLNREIAESDAAVELLFKRLEMIADAMTLPIPDESEQAGE